MNVSSKLIYLLVLKGITSCHCSFTFMSTFSNDILLLVGVLNLIEGTSLKRNDTVSWVLKVPNFVLLSL